MQLEYIRTNGVRIEVKYSEVEERTEALESIYSKFGRIMDVPALLNMTKEDRVTICSDFAAFYSADIDVTKPKTSSTSSITWRGRLLTRKRSFDFLTGLKFGRSFNQP